jgi:hypothetical protein
VKALATDDLKEVVWKSIGRAKKKTIPTSPVDLRNDELNFPVKQSVLKKTVRK